MLNWNGKSDLSRKIWDVMLQVCREYTGCDRQPVYSLALAPRLSGILNNDADYGSCSSYNEDTGYESRNTYYCIHFLNQLLVRHDRISHCRAILLDTLDDHFVPFFIRK